MWLGAFLLLPTVQGALHDNQIQTHGCNVQSFYDFNWDEVYTRSRYMPQGCSCSDSAIDSDADCTIFDCDCGCDLTAGACDSNCCCDPDCSPAEVSRFENSDAGCTLHEDSPAFQQCYDVETVNERYDMEYTGTSKEAIDELLCVSAENAEIKGEYYSDPGNYESDSTIFDDAKGQKAYAYTSVVPGSTKDSGTATEYYRGDAMRAATANGGRSAFGGYFPMPTAGPGGQCIETSYGHFMEPVRSNSCTRIVADLKASCETALSPERYTDISVCANHKTLFSSCENWVNVEIGTVSYRNPHTLEEFTESIDSAPVTSLHLEGSDVVCENSIVEACYYFYYSPEGAITQVILDLTVTNVTAASPTILSQDYSIEWVSSSPPTVDAVAEGNAVLRSRSGNPGYISGLPLLNAELVSSESSEAMNARVPGLLVYGSSATPWCDDAIPNEVVNFGEDLMTGCALEVSYSNFTELCAQTGPLVQEVTPGRKVPKYLWMNSSFNYLGTFGNADPLDPSQWMEMSIEEQPNEPSLDDAARVCSSLTTSLHYQFLVAYVGSTNNPQAKVVGARAFYGTEAVVFSSEEDTQSIMLTTTVSFVTLAQEDYETYVPPAPPVLWAVPYDVFYPFDVSAGSSRFTPSRLVLVYAIAGAVAVVLVTMP